MFLCTRTIQTFHFQYTGTCMYRSDEYVGPYKLVYGVLCFCWKLLQNHQYPHKTVYEHLFIGKGKKFG